MESSGLPDYGGIRKKTIDGATPIEPTTQIGFGLPDYGGKRKAEVEGSTTFGPTEVSSGLPDHGGIRKKTIEGSSPLVLRPREYGLAGPLGVKPVKPISEPTPINIIKAPPKWSSLASSERYKNLSNADRLKVLKKYNNEVEIFASKAAKTNTHRLGFKKVLDMVDGQIEIARVGHVNDRVNSIVNNLEGRGLLSYWSHKDAKFKDSLGTQISDEDMDFLIQAFNDGDYRGDEVSRDKTYQKKIADGLTNLRYKDNFRNNYGILDYQKALDALEMAKAMPTVNSEGIETDELKRRKKHKISAIQKTLAQIENGTDIADLVNEIELRMERENRKGPFEGGKPFKRFEGALDPASGRKETIWNLRDATPREIHVIGKALVSGNYGRYRWEDDSDSNKEAVKWGQELIEISMNYSDDYMDTPIGVLEIGEADPIDFDQIFGSANLNIAPLSEYSIYQRIPKEDNSTGKGSEVQLISDEQRGKFEGTQVP